nr:hypothetical protein [Candidatus Sigynarchaeota archaeon]
MSEEILKFTKLTFLIHFIFGIFYTILFWMPEQASILFGLSSTYTPMVGAYANFLASALVGFTVSSLFGYKAKEWKAVKIVVISEVVFLGFLIAAEIINAVLIGPVVVFFLIIDPALLVLFLVSFLKQEGKIK